MRIELSLQENYKFHLNNAINLLNKALLKNHRDSYINGFCSSAFALELGLLLAYKETINGDIFKRNKNAWKSE